MLITFQSTASPDVVMLRDLAQYLLGLIGKRLSERGVIMHDELPAAIDRLESAITEDASAEVALEALHRSPGNRREPSNGLSHVAVSGHVARSPQARRGHHLGTVGGC